MSKQGIQVTVNLSANQCSVLWLLSDRAIAFEIMTYADQRAIDSLIRMGFVKPNLGFCSFELTGTGLAAAQLVRGLYKAKADL